MSVKLKFIPMGFEIRHFKVQAIRLPFVKIYSVWSLKHVSGQIRGRRCQ